MTGIFASIRVTGKPRCARCKRPFTPKSPGQDVGPKCARILAGMIDVGALDRLDTTDAEGEPGAKMSAEESAVDAYRRAVII